MGRSAFKSAKRTKELKRLKKQEEKRLRRQGKEISPEEGEESAPDGTAPAPETSEEPQTN